MRNPATEKAVLDSQKTNSDTSLNISHPSFKHNIFGPPSLGKHWRDAKNMAALLENIQSGLSTFQRVQIALINRHGQCFQKELIREVRRGS